MLCAPFTAEGGCATPFTVGGSCATIVVAGILAALFALGGVTRAADTSPAVSYSAVAKPWREVDLSFSRPGRMVKILVHRGQQVKSGQLLASENDQQQKLAAKLAGLMAKSTLRIQAAQAELAQDTVSLKRTQWAASQHAATPFEVRRAQLKVTIDKLSLALARLKHQKDQFAWQTAKLAVQRREIRAPFDGVIEDRFIDAGGSVNAFKKVLEIVQTDRLRIFVPTPLRIGMGLQLGQSARVLSAEGGTALGRIIWIAMVADSASNTLMVEIRVNNKNRIPAGQEVQVAFIAAQAPDKTVPPGNEKRTAQRPARSTGRAQP